MTMRRFFTAGLCAGGLVGFMSQAQAADIPAPMIEQPITYVAACDAFGAGYFQIPGKDTCLKIGGRIRAQVLSGNFMENENIPDGDGDKPEEYSLYTRGYLYLDSMTSTEYGLLTTKATFLYEWDESSSDTAKFDDTYLQFTTGDSSVLVGRKLSLFDGFIGYTSIGTVSRNFSEHYLMQANVTASVGNGITFSAGIEDSEERGGPTDNADFVAVAELAQEWGSFRIAGGLHRNFETAYELPENGYRLYMAALMPDSFFAGGASLEDGLKAAETKNQYGYGVNATATFNVPVTQNLTELTFQAAYMDSAISYLGGMGGFLGNFDIETGEKTLANATVDFLGLTGYSFTGGIKHELTEEVTFALDASYAVVEGEHKYFGNGFNTTTSQTDISRMAIDGSITWSPVAGLAFSVNAGYAQTETNLSANVVKTSDGSELYKGKVDETFDEAYVGTRLQYTF